MIHKFYNWLSPSTLLRYIELSLLSLAFVPKPRSRRGHVSLLVVHKLVAHLTLLPLSQQKLHGEVLKKERKIHAGVLKQTTTHTLALPLLDQLGFDELIVGTHVINFPATVAVQKVRNRSGNLEVASDIEGVRTVKQPVTIAFADVFELDTIEVGMSGREVSQQGTSAASGISVQWVVVDGEDSFIESYVLHGDIVEVSPVEIIEVIRDDAVNEVNLSVVI
jgi:hypothetical protein